MYTLQKEANPFDRKVTPKQLIPVKLHYALDAGRRHLNIRNLPLGSHRFSDELQAATYVHRFLRLLQVRPAYDSEPGATWLELLIAFEVHGGKLQQSLSERAAIDMALPMMTTRQLLDQFKAIVRFVLETCGDEIDAKLFRTFFRQPLL